MIDSLATILEILSFSPEATAIYDNPDLRIAYANPKMLTIWGREEKIVGNNFGDVFPEFTRQGFTDILKDVWKSGKTYTDAGVPVHVTINEVPTLFHFDFEYRSILRNGETYAILHTAREVSDRKIAFDTLEATVRDQRDLNDKLMVDNKELIVSNREIQSYSKEYQLLNERLNDSLQSLATAYEDLHVSHINKSLAEEKARLILHSAPVAIGIIDLPDLLLESANKLLLEILLIDPKYIGQPLQHSISEETFATLQYFLEEVLRTKEIVTANELMLYTGEKPRNSSQFHNYVFQPIEDQHGNITSVMVVANDVTTQRNDKVEVDYQLEQAKLARMATKLGIFDFNFGEDSFSCDERCQEILSLATAAVDYRRDFLNRIHPEDKKRVLAEIKKSFTDEQTNGQFVSTLRVAVPAHTPPLWVQLYGQVYFDKDRHATRFIGTIKDVTEATQLRHDLEKSEQSLIEANEELAATLEELTASNEEIQATNEELQQAQRISDEYYNKLQHTNERLSESEDRLHVAIEGAELGIWDVDLVQGIVNWDLRTRELFGLTAHDVVPHQLIWNHVHAEDRDRVQQEVAWSRDIRSNGIFNSQFRSVEREDNPSRWLQLKGKVHFNADRMPVRFSGTILDITERVIAQQQADTFNMAIEKKDIEQRMIVEAGGIGTFSYDIDNKVVTTNALIRKHLNLDNHRELYTDRIFKHQIGDNPTNTQKRLLNTIIEEQSFDTEFQLIGDHSKQTKWLRAIGQKVKNGDQGGDIVYGVVIDITGQKMEEKRKLDFLGIVSHELKSPLTSLSGYLQILEAKSKKLQEEQFSSLLNSASHQANRIKLLIEGFLDVARYGEGKLKLHAKDFAITNLFEEIEKTFQETVSTHQLNFKVDYNGTVKADRDKMEQVLINLINNAVKYAPTGTEVNVRASFNSHSLRVEVSDQGPGIKPEDQQKIFDRFYRVENDNTELISGFGIGLYICSEIIKLHQGTIGVLSESGHGTTFWFELPAHNA